MKLINLFKILFLIPKFFFDIIRYYIHFRAIDRAEPVRRDVPSGPYIPYSPEIKIDRRKKKDAVLNDVFDIEFVNKKGEISQRTIRIYTIQKDKYSEMFYLESYCFLRNDYRTFRCDSIRRLTRLSDGLFVENTYAFFKHYYYDENRKIGKMYA